MKKSISSFLIFLFLCVSPASAFMNFPSRYYFSASGWIKNFGSYRAWSDGTYPLNCQGYKATIARPYSGAIGDGVYRVNINGTATDVFCLMTFDSNGWVLINQYIPNTSYVTTNYSDSQSFHVTSAISLYYTLSSTTQFIKYVSSKAAAGNCAAYTNAGYLLRTNTTGISKLSTGMIISGNSSSQWWFRTASNGINYGTGENPDSCPWYGTGSINTNLTTQMRFIKNPNLNCNIGGLNVQNCGAIRASIFVR